MYQAIDRRGRRHLIPKDPIPLREDQIAGDSDGASLVALDDVGYIQQSPEEAKILFTLLAQGTR
jgi:hypothetical protein